MLQSTFPECFQKPAAKPVARTSAFDNTPAGSLQAILCCSPVALRNISLTGEFYHPTLSPLASLLHRCPCCFTRLYYETDVKGGTKKNSCLSHSRASVLIHCQLLSPFPPRLLHRADVSLRCPLALSSAVLQQPFPRVPRSPPGSPCCDRQKDGLLPSCLLRGKR